MQPPPRRPPTASSGKFFFLIEIELLYFPTRGAGGSFCLVFFLYLLLAIRAMAILRVFQSPQQMGHLGHNIPRAINFKKGMLPNENGRAATKAHHILLGRCNGYYALVKVSVLANEMMAWIIKQTD